ncbi:hypothetical protein IFM89_023690 [Coptis chinensis]|uniref:Uncharacterized protein n=1 Tax=Coptis chinensis TaxID=261450 RepID=A0A835GZ11_9MAGN|nr:hypothetical protein IFM89_023690 [Coptis chinensis]
MSGKILLNKGTLLMLLKWIVVCGMKYSIFSTFLHTEYGGPGMLLVVPFIDMADTINERGLPGGPQAARTTVVWAQKHVDKDWNEWTGDEDNQ